MDIIAQSQGRFQSLPHRKVEVFSSGVYVPKTGKNFVPDCLRSKDRTQRGQITNFSTHARQRLRRLLVESTVPNSERLGFTLTLPWRDIEWDGKAMAEFRECFNRFGVKFRRSFPKSAAIFRVELQKRKAPHVHAIWFLHNDDIIARDLSIDLPSGRKVKIRAIRELFCRGANDEISRLWCSCVPIRKGDNVRGFFEHGTQVDDIVSDGAMFRYLADHASKSKQAQLGYQGKQWGVLGGKNLVKVEPDTFDFRKSRKGFKSKAVLIRNLQKICRYRVKKPGAPFGSCYRKSGRTVGTFYASELSVKRLLSQPAIASGLRASRFEQKRLC